jgi:hypothetical protein
LGDHEKKIKFDFIPKYEVSMHIFFEESILIKLKMCKMKRNWIAIWLLKIL